MRTRSGAREWEKSTRMFPAPSPGVELNPVSLLFAARPGSPDEGAAVGAGLRPAQPAPEYDPRLADAHPLRILLAEDNAVNQKLALRLLQRRGHSVAIATDGREVLNMLDQESFDLILMDVQMPAMDGIEAISRRQAACRGTTAADRRTPARASSDDSPPRHPECCARSDSRGRR